MQALNRIKQAFNIATDWRFSDHHITLGKTQIKRDEAISVISKLKLLTEQLTQKDIKSWRQANQTAIFLENPKRWPLYGIYDDAMHDLHLKGAVRNRKMAVVGKPFIIKDASGNKNDDLTELLKSKWFKQFLNLAIDSVFYGHSLIELTGVDRTDKLKFTNVELVPRYHVCPEYGVVLPYFTDWPDKGIPYREELADTCIEVCKSKKDLGELNSPSKEAISKKYVLQFWDQFAEMFGMPIRVGKTTSRDPKDHEKVQDMLEKMGAAAWGLFPEGTSIEVIGSQQRDAFKVYDQRIIRANSEISKAILGQTMTMDNGSSRAQALVHEDVADDIAEDDRDFIRDVVNDDLFPFLIKHGWPLKGFKFDWDDAHEYSPEEMKDIEEMLLKYYDVEPEYFIDKYGVKIMGKKEIKPTDQQDPLNKNNQKKKLSSQQTEDFYD
ncbi:MAG TPA: DUF935 family protein [Lentimicrobium sp.]|nr:DUF935 family protein [Lentimicrobium sp.]